MTTPPRPQIRKLAALKLAGLHLVLDGPAGGPMERFRGIPDLWRGLMTRVHEIPGRLGGERYALIENDLFPTAEAPVYRALVAVESFEGLPDWVVDRVEIPAGDYACFEHRGSPREVGRTIYAVKAAWSGEIPDLFARNREIIVYPGTHDPSDPNGTLEIRLPR